MMKTKNTADKGKKELTKTFVVTGEHVYELFKNSPMPTTISNLKEGNIFEVNESMLNLLGYKRGDVIGKSAMDLSIWVDSAERKSIINQVKKSGLVKNMPIRVRTKKGEIRELVISVNKAAIEDDEYLIWSACDVTESAQKEAAILESEEKYRSIVENSNDAILMTDNFSDLIFVNNQATDITGFSRDEMLSMNLIEIFGRNFPKSIKRLYSQSVSGQIPEKLTWIFKNNRKEEKYLEVKVSSFKKAEKKDRVVIQMLDNTEGHLAKKALKESDERFFKVLELANDFVWEVDDKGLLTFVSSRAFDITGYKEKDLRGKLPFDFSALDNRDDVLDRIRKLWAERTPLIQVERKFTHKDGREIILESSSVPYFDSEGNFRGYRGVSRDITERKNAENLLKKREEDLETKTILLEEANAALKVLIKHRERAKEEIEEKILMNVREMVLPFIEKMKATKLDVIQEAYMNIIESHLDDIISNFLQRIKSKTMTFTPRETQIASLIREGKSTRDITMMLGMSKSAVEFHRNRIRIKLGLNKKKINLRTSLLSIK